MKTKILILIALLTLSCGEKNNENNDTPTSDMGQTSDVGVDTGEEDDDGVTPGDAGPDQDTGPELRQLYEIVLDDDVADFALNPVGAQGFISGAEIVQFFEPPADGRLHSARIVIGNDISGQGGATGPVEIVVYDATGPSEGPGELLLDPAPLAQAEQGIAFPHPAGVTWIDVDLAEYEIPATTDGLFVGVRYVTSVATSSPPVAMDVHEAAARDNAWLLIPGEDWQPYLNALPDELEAGPMIRATFALPEDVEIDEPVLLSNAPRDCRGYLWGVFPSNLESQWAAARLLPEQAPFEVTSLRYEVANTGESMPACDAQLPHRIGIWVGGETPDANAEPVETFDIELNDADALLSFLTPVDLTLTTPIRLEEGEALYMAFEAAPTDPQACVAVCSDNYAPEHSWLSSTLAPPFDWISFTDGFGPQGTVDLAFRAYGRVVE